MPAFLGGVGSGRERGAGGGDPSGRPGGAAVLVGDDGAAEGRDPDAQEPKHERGATGGRREPEPVLEAGGRAAVRASAVSHILAEQRAAVRAESGEWGVADAQVRDRGAVGADAAAQGVGGDGGAAAGAGARQESHGGRLRPLLHPPRLVGGGAAREGAGGGAKGPRASGRFGTGIPINLQTYNSSRLCPI